jgi:hypothetical protein
VSQPPAAREPEVGKPVIPAQPGPPAVAPPALPLVKPPTTPRFRSRRTRLWLALGLGIVALLCLGGVGVFVSLYDNATAIKRTSPDAVADSFLRAYLVDRDDKEASLFMCKSGGDFTALSALRTQSIDREKQFDVKVVVTWGILTVTGTGDDRRDVATGLIIAGTKNGVTQSRHTESWQLGLVQDDGWRVCSATKQP